jgi:hypothetical protein
VVRIEQRTMGAIESVGSANPLVEMNKHTGEQLVN